MILVIRTDKPDAELLLFNENKKIDEHSWLAHRNLADELLPEIQILLKNNSASFDDLKGIIVFTGEGSFTGLRIGTTVANALAYSLSIPIVEASGDDWLNLGLSQVKNTKPGKYVVPKYSSEPNITKPKNG